MNLDYFLYNNLIGSWSRIYQIKTSDIKLDSNILKEKDEKIHFLKVVRKWIEFKKLELLYRGTRDGGDGANFYEKCDNQGPIIVLCKNDKGNIFGGYASVSWAKIGKSKPSPDNFIFNFTNIYNTEPTKFNLKR